MLQLQFAVFVLQRSRDKTRWFSNHESRLRIHQSMWIQWPFLQKLERSLTPRWPLIPHLLRSYVWLYPRIIVSKSHENTSKYVEYSDLFLQKTWARGSLTPRWPLTPTSVEVTCVTLPKDYCVQVPWEYVNVCGYSDQFCKLPTKVHWPLDDLWPHICWGLMCDATQGSLCPNLMKIHQSMWIQWPFLQNLSQRSLTPTWPLTPHLLRSHVWL